MITGIVIHGYGGDKKEMKPLIDSLSERLNLRLFAIDLPGHGEMNHLRFNLKNSLAVLDKTIKSLDRPAFIIGHSAGARLGLMANLPTVAAVSPPGKAVFEGTRTEMLRTLRANRVNETFPYSGLKEILAHPANPAPRTLVLTAENDLKSVNDLIALWTADGIVANKIATTNHLNIIESATTHRMIGDWLEEELKMNVL